MICHSCAKNEEVLPLPPNPNSDLENWYRFKTRKIDQSQRAYDVVFSCGFKLVDHVVTIAPYETGSRFSRKCWLNACYFGKIAWSEF